MILILWSRRAARVFAAGSVHPDSGRVLTAIYKSFLVFEKNKKGGEGGETGFLVRGPLFNRCLCGLQDFGNALSFSPPSLNFN